MRNLAALLACAVLSVTFVRAQTATPDEQAADQIFHQLIDAQTNKDYDAFVAKGTLELKAALTKTQFDASSDLMIARLKSGCDIDPLGELNKKGYQVYLYRLRFKDGGDDLLGTLTLKDGLVAGIYFK